MYKISGLFFAITSPGLNSLKHKSLEFVFVL